MKRDSERKMTMKNLVTCSFFFFFCFVSNSLLASCENIFFLFAGLE